MRGYISKCRFFVLTKFNQSILDEIDYKYPAHNAYFSYMTRGCVRRCPFCVVYVIEPEYVPYIPLKERE